MSLTGLWRSLVGGKDSVRLAILVTGALVLVSGFGLFLQWRTFRAYVEALPRAERTLDVIQQKSGEIGALEKEVTEDALLAAADQPTLFIRQQAAKANMGDLNALQQTKAERGYEDSEFRIQPPDKNKFYNRQQLATFFWLIENTTSRMRVTQLKMSLYDKKKAWESPEDLWTFSGTLTSRTRKARGE